MLRDERLQKVVSDIDSAPDRERVSRGVRLAWRSAASSSAGSWVPTGGGTAWQGPGSMHTRLLHPP